MNGDASITLRTEDESPGLAADNRMVAEQEAAQASLRRVRDELLTTVADSAEAASVLRTMIVTMRPQGILSVDEMGAAVGRDRNYIDSVWSQHGATTTGRQTRITMIGAPDEQREAAMRSLAVADKLVRKAAETEKTARAERDRVVAMVYASKILGPSAIAAAAAIDRNHVLRLARKAGVAPMHRAASRNQYSPRKRGRKSAPK